MASSAAPSTLFADLPDDCLLLIIDEIAALRGEGRSKCKTIRKLSTVNKRLRQLCLSKLFKATKIDLSKASPTIATFQAALRAPHVVSSLLAVKVDLGHNGAPLHNQAFCDSLVGALTAMTHLAELDIDVNNNNNVVSNLRDAFKHATATLSCIRTLKMSYAPNAPFIIRACTNLKTFIASNIEQKWKSTFAPLSSMTSLRQVEIDTDINWTPRRVEELLPYMKNVSELCIKGELWKASPSTFAPSFGHFKQLTSLSMTTTQWINEKYIANYYVDDRFLDEIDYQREEHELNEDEQEVALAFFTDCPSLFEFRGLFALSGTKYRCEREAGGKVIKVEIVDEEEEEKDESYGFPLQFNFWDEW